jgi:hypothetical protein
MSPTPTVAAIIMRVEALAAAHAARVAWCETCVQTHWGEIEARRLTEIAERLARRQNGAN